MPDKRKARTLRCGGRKRANVETRPCHGFDRLRLNTDETTVKWVFHRASDATWRWQKMSLAHGVIAESQQSFSHYVECVADARDHGHTEWLAPAKLVPLSFSHTLGPHQKGPTGSAAQPLTPQCTVETNELVAHDNPTPALDPPQTGSGPEK